MRAPLHVVRQNMHRRVENKCHGSTPLRSLLPGCRQAPQALPMINIAVFPVVPQVVTKNGKRLAVEANDHSVQGIV